MRRERDAAKRKVLEMEQQLEETKRRLQAAEVSMKKQRSQIEAEVSKKFAKPPKLISVAVEFPDIDNLDSSCSELETSTSTVESDEMGIGFGVEEQRERERLKPHQTWLQKANKLWLSSAPPAPSDSALKMSEEKGFERRVLDGAEERNEFYRKNSNIVQGKLASAAYFDEDGGGEGSFVAPENAGVTQWLQRVQHITGMHVPVPPPPPPALSPPRPEKSLQPQMSLSPQHAYLERVSGILKEPGLSPSKKSVAFSQQTIDFGSEDEDDEDGSIRSLRTEEAFSPSTSFAATETSQMSRSFRFSKAVMSSETIEDASVNTSMSKSAESGAWMAKGGKIGGASSNRAKQKYYAQRLDESFESGKSIGSKKLERGGRVPQSRWDRLYEEAEGSSDDSDY